MRLTHGKTDTRRSLGTKDLQRAKLSALLLTVQIEMSRSRLDAEMFRHLDIALPNGVKLANIQPEDRGIHDFEIKTAKNRDSIRKFPMHREIEASWFPT